MERLRMVFLLCDHVVALPDAVGVGPTTLSSQSEGILAERGIAVADDFGEQRQGAFSLLALCLPQMFPP